MSYNDRHTNIAVWLSKAQKEILDDVLAAKGQKRSAFIRGALKNQLRSTLQGKLRSNPALRNAFDAAWSE